MKLDIASTGRIVICNVTPKAWAYIEERRKNRAYSQYDAWGHWCFSKELYNGSAYVTLEPEKFKGELVEILDDLTDKFGLEMSEAARHVFIAWAREAHCERQFGMHLNAIEKRDERIKALKELSMKGCGRFCKNFRLVQWGDDLIGYCMMDENHTKLKQATVHGEMNQFIHVTDPFLPNIRYFPHEGCQYFKNE